jgi:hypothetical protein
MDAKMVWITAKMDRRPGVSPQQLEAIFTPLNFRPPDDYVGFMAETNGSEGPIGALGYLAIYSTQELLDCNAQTMTLEPGILFFGTDRGGEGYAFELDTPSNGIVAVEFADLDRTRAKSMGKTFAEFLEMLSSERTAEP